MGRVLVTGGSGYVGGWCIVQLLEAGHDVVATIRDPAQEDAVRFSVATQVDADARLRFVIADLGQDHGWSEAVEGCEHVLHVASPLDADGFDDERMIALARDGSLRVLDVAERAGVRRVVMTSSTAASSPPVSETSALVDEDFWTDVDDPSTTAYPRSKTLAERAAWERVDGSPLELVTILPSAVFGPAISTVSLSSLRIIQSLLNGFAIALPRLGFEIVDVRDLAAAHLSAMDVADAAGHRFLACGEFRWYDEIADLLRARLDPDDASRIPTATLTDDEFRAVAADNEELQGVLRSLGREIRHRNDKAGEILGWEPRPVEDTLVDSARYLLAAGAV